MRAITELECEMVSGGDIMPEHVRRAVEEAYMEGRSRGLSHDEALRACGVLGDGVGAISQYASSAGVAVSLVCELAVNNYINYRNGTAGADCEINQGGTWNNETATCDP
jgi:hypothetical protein